MTVNNQATSCVSTVLTTFFISRSSAEGLLTLCPFYITANTNTAHKENLFRNTYIPPTLLEVNLQHEGITYSQIQW